MLDGLMHSPILTVPGNINENTLVLQQYKGCCFMLNIEVSFIHMTATVSTQQCSSQSCDVDSTASQGLLPTVLTAHHRAIQAQRSGDLSFRPPAPVH